MRVPRLIRHNLEFSLFFVLMLLAFLVNIGQWRGEPEAPFEGARVSQASSYRLGDLLDE